MPGLDPSAVVLSSPMLLDSFRVRRRTATVSDLGRTVTTDEVVAARGVVYASGDNSHDRTPEASTGKKAIDVITRFRLQDQVSGLIPDEVIWHGNNFLVITADDYTAYGKGWIQAHCESQDTVDAREGQR